MKGSFLARVFPRITSVPASSCVLTPTRLSRTPEECSISLHAATHSPTKIEICLWSSGCPGKSCACLIWRQYSHSIQLWLDIYLSLSLHHSYKGTDCWEVK